jgi:hypothetical protein
MEVTLVGGSVLGGCAGGRLGEHRGWVGEIGLGEIGDERRRWE